MWASESPPGTYSEDLRRILLWLWQGEKNHYEIHPEHSSKQRPTLKGKNPLPESYPSWEKVILPTAASSRLSVSVKGGKIVNRGQSFMKINWKWCSQERSKGLRRRRRKRSCCTIINTCEGPSPKIQVC